MNIITLIHNINCILLSSTRINVLKKIELRSCFIVRIVLLLVLAKYKKN